MVTPGSNKNVFQGNHIYIYIFIGFIDKYQHDIIEEEKITRVPDLLITENPVPED
jgi:hypothetical protein